MKSLLSLAHRLLAAGATLAVAACSEPSPAALEDAARPDSPAPPDTGSAVDGGDHPSIDNIPVEPGDPFDAELDGSPTRPRRRMDVDQLGASLRTVMGGIGWTTTEGGVETDQLEQLAATLGRPDYATTTEENLEITPIFEKFLNDAARMTCSARAQRDRESYYPEDRVLVARAELTDTSESAPDAIDANLRQLLLRFHGRRVAAGAPELAPWRWLFDEATLASTDPVEGWRTVCVGLVTHPDFYTY
ncbi:MAG: hypothetical protein ACK6CU_24230 [Deltaproteobacteria bacterium]